MPAPLQTEKLKDNHELVICDGETAGDAHRDLYHSRDGAYVIVDETENFFNGVFDIVASFNSEPPENISKIHLSFGWENLLKLSLWRDARPSAGDAFVLLKNAGVGHNEFQPFKNADINDLFPWLYYGKRFDVLRKLCHAAKRQVEGHLKDHSIRVDCHLVAGDTNRIVASSL